MKKVVKVILLVLFGFKSSGQIVTLPEKIDCIPSTDHNKQFLTYLLDGFHQQTKNNDSVLLLYVNSLYTNYAVLFARKGQNTNCEAYYEHGPNFTQLEEEKLLNQTLDSINFKYIYNIFLNNDVRTEDTTVDVFPRTEIYTAIFFGNKTTKYFVGHPDRFYYRLSPNFLTELINEKNRIYEREIQKYHQ